MTCNFGQSSFDTRRNEYEQWLDHFALLGVHALQLDEALQVPHFSLDLKDAWILTLWASISANEGEDTCTPLQVKSEFSLGVTQSIPCLQTESPRFAQIVFAMNEVALSWSWAVATAGRRRQDCCWRVTMLDVAPVEWLQAEVNVLWAGLEVVCHWDVNLRVDWNMFEISSHSALFLH